MDIVNINMYLYLSSVSRFSSIKLMKCKHHIYKIVTNELNSYMTKSRLISTRLTYEIIALALFLMICTSSCGAKPESVHSESWTQLASMPTPRSENAAAVVGEIIYVSGGFGGEQTLESYDTTT